MKKKIKKEEGIWLLLENYITIVQTGAQIFTKFY